MAGSAIYPYGSTARMRADVLTVLGVLKVATASQVQRITRPAARDNKVVRNALLDLVKHGLVVSDGRTQGPPGVVGRARVAAPAGPGEHPKSQKLYRLSPAGLDAAAQLLPAEHHTGTTARGAGRHGAPHAMATNEAIIAFLQPCPDLPPFDAADGLGTITSWATEVVLPVTGSVSAPSKGSPRPDAVLRAPESGPPLPFLAVEVDTGSEPPTAIGAKFDRYRRFFRRTISAPDGTHGRTRPVPYWTTLYSTSPYEGHPPVALVFAGAGPRGLANRMAAVEDLTRDHWAGQRRFERYYDAPDARWTEYDDAIPVLATTLPELQQHGPYGPIWRRFGHAVAREGLAAALANPDGEQLRERYDEAARRRRQAEEERRRQEQEEARRRREDEEAAAAAREAAEAAENARREACQGCGQPRHDDRWGTNPSLTHAPPPDGVHCSSCRTELNQPRTPFGRLARRLGGY